MSAQDESRSSFETSKNKLYYHTTMAEAEARARVRVRL